MGGKRSIKNAEDLYRKLERGFERRREYGEHQLDWVFDVAVTAWHLVDWVAREPRLKLEDCQADLKVQCLELGVCEQICNGTKHLVLNNPKLKPFDITQDVQTTNARAGVSRNGIVGRDRFDVVLTPSVGVTDKEGRSWEAMHVFRRVLAFWKQELRLR